MSYTPFIGLNCGPFLFYRFKQPKERGFYCSSKNRKLIQTGFFFFVQYVKTAVPVSERRSSLKEIIDTVVQLRRVIWGSKGFKKLVKVFFFNTDTGIYDF